MPISARLMGMAIGEPPQRLLQFAEFAHPFQAIARGHVNFFCDAVLRVLDRSGQVAAAHAELDGDITFLMLAVDEGRARNKPDVGDGRQRHRYRRTARRVGRAHLDMLDRIQAAAILRRQPHHDGIIAVAARLIKIAGRLAAHRGLNHIIDVARRQAKARSLGPVDANLDGRLAKRIEHRQIGDPGHPGHHRLYLRGGVFQGLQVIAEQLDGIFAFDA